MSLRERLETGNGATGTFGMPASIARGIDNRAYRELKARIHATLLDQIDLQVMESMTPGAAQG